MVNIPTMDILKETMFCGRASGRHHDKFMEAGLARLRGRKVKAPAIKECVAHLECKLHSQIATGDHTIFVGKIIRAYADREAFNEEYDLKKAKMIFHLSRNKFATLAPKIFKPKSRTHQDLAISVLNAKYTNRAIAANIPSFH